MPLQLLGDGVGFKVRAGAVLVRDGRLLVHSSVDGAHWVVPGGGVEFGETARDSLGRELREELACDAQVGLLLFLVEHFFESESRHWHQLAWLFEATLPDDCDAARREEWTFDDGEGPVTFRWTSFADLASTRLFPGFLAGAVRDLPREPRRVVHVDGRA